ncbi:MAG: hypothetical protein HQL31_09670 [Planctomycetes bacterium]|nr:hypothetical protein [Planctomycetota bacterium]
MRKITLFWFLPAWLLMCSACERSAYFGHETLVRRNATLGWSPLRPESGRIAPAVNASGKMKLEKLEPNTPLDMALDRGLAKIYAETTPSYTRREIRKDDEPEVFTLKPVTVEGLKIHVRGN